MSKQNFSLDDNALEKVNGGGNVTIVTSPQTSYVDGALVTEAVALASGIPMDDASVYPHFTQCSKCNYWIFCATSGTYGQHITKSSRCPGK